MVKKLISQSLFPNQEINDQCSINANSIGKLSTYLKTRGGLWRLLALFPDKSVMEALRLAPSVLTKERKGGSQC